MCLDIDYDVHPLRPKIADRPLVVWKALERDKIWSDTKCEYVYKPWQSPYWATPYTFGKLMKATMGVEIGSGIVEAGLHANIAATQQKAANNWGCSVRKSDYRTATEWMFPALIPAGSEFFIGLNDDVVSNQLIVFETLDDLLKHCGAYKLDAPIKRNTAGR